MSTPNMPPGFGQSPSGLFIPTPELTAEIHKLSDVDTSTTAQHHTLGILPSQASPGSHTHDGRDSKPIAAQAAEGNRAIASGGINQAVIFDAPATNMLLIAYLSNIAGQKGQYDITVIGAASVIGSATVTLGADLTGLTGRTVSSIFISFTALLDATITINTMTFSGTINEARWVVI